MRTLGRSDGDGQREFSTENSRGEQKDAFNISKNKHSKKYKIIANIPYNITGAILKKFLTEENQPERMVLMVQNEVAKRIVANNEPESILSISVKAYGSPKIITKVPARYFSPAPKVDSAIILIKDINKDFFQKNNIKEEIFWQIVKTGFAHKRKKLSSNLKSILKLDEKYLNARAENLKIEDWVELTKKYCGF
jgi:16S rRNA (adenine1518-N6/adenine1519-N6)-dimethyltransferase